MSKNLASFLFGNVDEEGHLENDGLDAELKASLEQADSDFLSKAIGGSLGLDFINNLDLKNDPDTIKPNKNALDFSSIEEIAEESEIHVGDVVMKESRMVKPTVRPSTSYEAPQNMPEDNIDALLKQYLPDYVIGGPLKFTSLFRPRQGTIKKRMKKIPEPKAVQKQEYFVLADDDVVRFYKMSNFTEIPDYLYEKKRKEIEKEENQKADTEVSDSVRTAVLIHNGVKLDPLTTDTWEDRIIWDSEDENRNAPTIRNVDGIAKFVMNHSLESVDWTEAIIWDDDYAHNQDFKLPDAEDPSIIPPIIPEAKTANGQSSMPSNIYRFNISDDHLYDSNKNKNGRLRQTHGPIRLQHSLPAIKLMHPYFKFQLTIQEMRSFHRPPLKFNSTEVISFTRLKNPKLKKKELKTKEAVELMRSVKDITLRDSSKYVLFEFSEENPSIMSNTGMACLVYNYYRKIDEKDTYVPLLDHGSPYILDQVDASPFFGFGDVGRGQTIQAIFNNLYRAPIFKHAAPNTDFLVIRYRNKGVSKYYLREISGLYCVGQIFPAMEVPRPQSRKNNNVLKSRLQVAAFRLMRQDPLRRLKLETLFKLFPDFSEGQIRQKVKEFAVFNRKGNSGSWWKLKPGFSLPTEEELRRLLGPEMACLYDSMLVGEQWLRDAGYAASLDMGDDDDEDTKETMEIEVQLTPWTVTRNFIQAAQGKCMLQLYGPGDPTGIGEGFSFMKTSMKEIFLRAGETVEERLSSIDARARYNRFSIAEQQTVYREEIDRIWGNLVRSLSSKDEIVWDEEMEDANQLELSQTQMELEEARRRQDFGMAYAYSPPTMPLSPPHVNQPLPTAVYSDGEQDDTMSVDSRSTYNYGKNKVLVIKRLVRNEDGDFVWKSEAVTNQKVMNAYLRQRTKIMGSQDGSPNNDEFGSKRKKKKRRLQDQSVVQTPISKDVTKLKASTTSVSLTLKIPAAKTMEAMKASIQIQRDAQDPKAKRRKGKPQAELSKIFEEAVQSMIDLPEAFAFCKPVNPAIIKDYYDIVQNPKTLEEIRDDVKANKYSAMDAFVSDLQLVADNCNLYNGPSHPLTGIIQRIVDEAKDKLFKNLVVVRKLETEIAEQRRIQAESESRELEIEIEDI